MHRYTHAYMCTHTWALAYRVMSPKLYPLCQKSQIKELLLQPPTMPSAALSHNQTSVFYGVPSLGPLGFCFGHLSSSVRSLSLSEIFQTFSNKVEPKKKKMRSQTLPFQGASFRGPWWRKTNSHRWPIAPFLKAPCVFMELKAALKWPSQNKASLCRCLLAVNRTLCNL